MIWKNRVKIKPEIDFLAGILDVLFSV